MFPIRLFIQHKSLPLQAHDGVGMDCWLDYGGGLSGFGVRSGSELRFRIYGKGSFVVQPGSLDVLGFPDEGVDVRAFREAFFHDLAPWLLQCNQWDAIHSSAVLTAGGVIAFSGHSGRGKSTMARALVERGALPFADDALLFVLRDGVVHAASLPQRLRLREPAASHFRDVPAPEQIAAAGAGEVSYDPLETLRPLRTIYWLEPFLDGTLEPAVQLERVQPVHALPLLLSAAQCMSMQDPACNRKMVDNYLALAEQTPLYRLRFVREISRIPTILDCLEKHQVSLPAAVEARVNLPHLLQDHSSG